MPSWGPDLVNKLISISISITRKKQISKTKETSKWTCSVCKIDVHLYASIVCDGCLECARTILNVLASKRLQNPARTGYADSAITKESNLIISYVIPSL
jgi:hypothetical protein